MGFTNLNPNKNKYFAVPEELKGYKNWVCWQSYPCLLYTSDAADD